MKKGFVVTLILLFAFAALGWFILQSNGVYDDQNGQQSSGQLSDTGTETPTATPQQSQAEEVILDVPFTAQAPLGNWADPRQQNGCEEAAALMAVRWAEGIQEILPQDAEKEIIAISDFEQSTYGHYHDTSAQDMVERIFMGYFKYDKIQAHYDITVDDIKSELDKGNLVLVPVNGQKLDNPYYLPPGPEEHMLVIRGYNNKTGEFITNDSGTKQGNLLRYPQEVVMDAIYDYPTGYHEPVKEIVKAMIVVSPKV